MAELADAHGSGPCDSNIMRVQVPFSASKTDERSLVFFVLHTYIPISMSLMSTNWILIGVKSFSNICKFTLAHS